MHFYEKKKICLHFLKSSIYSYQWVLTLIDYVTGNGRSGVNTDAYKGPTVYVLVGHPVINTKHAAAGTKKVFRLVLLPGLQFFGETFHLYLSLQCL